MEQLKFFLSDRAQRWRAANRGSILNENGYLPAIHRGHDPCIYKRRAAVAEPLLPVPLTDRMRRIQA